MSFLTRSGTFPIVFLSCAVSLVYLYLINLRLNIRKYNQSFDTAHKKALIKPFENPVKQVVKNHGPGEQESYRVDFSVTSIFEKPLLFVRIEGGDCGTLSTKAAVAATLGDGIETKFTTAEERLLINLNKTSGHRIVQNSLESWNNTYSISIIPPFKGKYLARVRLEYTSAEESLLQRHQLWDYKLHSTGKKQTSFIGKTLYNIYFDVKDLNKNALDVMNENPGVGWHISTQCYGHHSSLHEQNLTHLWLEDYIALRDSPEYSDKYIKRNVFKQFWDPYCQSKNKIKVLNVGDSQPDYVCKLVLRSDTKPSKKTPELKCRTVRSQLMRQSLARYRSIFEKYKDHDVLILNVAGLWEASLGYIGDGERFETLLPQVFQAVVDQGYRSVFISTTTSLQCTLYKDLLKDREHWGTTQPRVVRVNELLLKVVSSNANFSNFTILQTGRVTLAREDNPESANDMRHFGLDVNHEIASYLMHRVSKHLRRLGRCS